MSTKSVKNSFQTELDLILHEDNLKGSANIELESYLLEDKDDTIKFLLLKEIQSLGFTKESIELYAQGVKKDPSNFIYHVGHAFFNQLMTKVIKNALEHEKIIQSLNKKQE